jgi:hypothetical protein
MRIRDRSARVGSGIRDRSDGITSWCPRSVGRYRRWGVAAEIGLAVSEMRIRDRSVRSVVGAVCEIGRTVSPVGAQDRSDGTGGGGRSRDRASRIGNAYPRSVGRYRRCGVSEIGQTVSLAGTRCRSDGIGGGGIRDRSDGITSGYPMSVRRYRWRGIGDRSDGITSGYLMSVRRYRGYRRSVRRYH